MLSFVQVAANTTAQARLKLYSYLEQLGPRALYADTDSVVYTSRPGEWKPELGDYLGDLTDEVPDNRIIEFVTGGPKNYAYKIARPRMTRDCNVHLIYSTWAYVKTNKSYISNFYL
jgi:hypothetical protein